MKKRANKIWSRDCPDMDGLNRQTEGGHDFQHINQEIIDRRPMIIFIIVLRTVRHLIDPKRFFRSCAEEGFPKESLIVPFLTYVWPFCPSERSSTICSWNLNWPSLDVINWEIYSKCKLLFTEIPSFIPFQTSDDPLSGDFILSFMEGEFKITDAVWQKSS